MKWQHRVPFAVRPRAAIGLLALAWGLAGCAGPLAWEKANLARPEMQLDNDPLAARWSSHLYSSREAAIATSGVGGSGCGCN